MPTGQQGNLAIGSLKAKLVVGLQEKKSVRKGGKGDHAKLPAKVDFLAIFGTLARSDPRGTKEGKNDPNERSLLR